jgi:hypothetical protein
MDDVTLTFLSVGPAVRWWIVDESVKAGDKYVRWWKDWLNEAIVLVAAKASHWRMARWTTRLGDAVSALAENPGEGHLRARYVSRHSTNPYVADALTIHLYTPHGEIVLRSRDGDEKLDVTWVPVSSVLAARMLASAWFGGRPDELVEMGGERMFVIEALATLTRAAAMEMRPTEEKA